MLPTDAKEFVLQILVHNITVLIPGELKYKRFSKWTFYDPFLKGITEIKSVPKLITKKAVQRTCSAIGFVVL